MNLLSIIVPVKDESANVRPLYEKVKLALANGPAWELIFVDDGSADTTFEALSEIAQEDPRIRVLRLRRNFGQSAAMQAGIDHAQGDVLATMDGDLQNDPADLPMMLAKLDEGYDVVLGQRANRKDSFVIRKLPSLVANWLIRKVTKVPFKDFGCTLRVMRRSVASSMRIYGEMHRFITALALQEGARMAQVPVTHHPRRAGKSKYNITRTFRVILDLLTVKFMQSYLTRPMHFLGGTGLAMMLFGFFSLATTITMKLGWEVDMTGNPLLLLSVMFILMGGQTILMGLLGEVMSRTYFESQNKNHYAIRETRNVPATPFNESRAA